LAEPSPDIEKLPTNDMIKVIEYVTINKNEKWWTAVVLAGEEGRKKVMLYMWNKRDGTWKRLQKFTIGRKSDWPLYKDAIEKLLEKID
jgi:6-phosphogluconolactonase (cycloisomerase 2 family)